MDREKADRIINKAVESLKKKFPKMEVRAGRCVFTAGGVTLKIEVAEIGQDGTVLNREATDWKRWEKIIGLPPLGTEFRWAGTTFKTVGYRRRARKKPILARNPEGRLFIFPIEAVQKAVKP